MQKDYRRMGGWLLFFVITGIAGSLANLTTAFNVLSAGYVLLGILVFSVIALRVTVIVQIFRRDETARYWLAGEGVLMLVTNFYTAYLAAWDTMTIVQSIASVGAYVLWFFYLTRSLRVAVYLHPDQYVPAAPQFYQGGMQYGQPVQPPRMPQPAPAAVCPVCGGAVTPGMRFCGKCGHSLQ
ncbi:MAG: zinc ribbon domain-containing protein [Ruthenibacterium sp.]